MSRCGGVLQVSTGTRYVLAIEFWEHAGIRFEDFRLSLEQAREREQRSMDPAVVLDAGSEIDPDSSDNADTNDEL
jgi:hypothetical protein